MSVEKIGGLPTAEIEQLALAEGVLPREAGISNLTRLSQRLIDLLRLRSVRGELKGFSIFLLSEKILEDKGKISSAVFPALRNGHDTLSGAVWLTNPSLATAYKLSIPWGGQTTIFENVQSAGFGMHPAFLVDWRGGAPQVMVYPSGIESADGGEAVHFDNDVISMNEMYTALNNFYRRSLRNPGLVVEGSAQKIWKHANKGIPAPRPEQRIQGRLLDTLKGRFPDWPMRAEPQADEGRADLIVFRNTTDVGGFPAIRIEWLLELKALCDKTHTNDDVAPAKIKSAVQSGLGQIQSYKKSFNPVASALCCYDMRKNDETDASCFAHIQANAAKDGIHLWRWFLLRSAEASRAVSAAASASA
jgi:hypothetical protein